MDATPAAPNPDPSPAAGARWTHRASREMPVTADRVWACMADTGSWSRWNDGVAAIDLHGPFETGSSFTMHMPDGSALTSRLLDVRPGQGFTDETVVGDDVVRVAHTIEPIDAHRVRVVYATEVPGAGRCRDRGGGDRGFRSRAGRAGAPRRAGRGRRAMTIEGPVVTVRPLTPERVGRELAGAISFAGHDAARDGPAGDGVEVCSLAVWPRWQRAGIGAMLLPHVIDTAGDCALRVSTARANAPAVALYRRAGFAPHRIVRVGDPPLELVQLRRPAAIGTDTGSTADGADGVGVQQRRRQLR